MEHIYITQAKSKLMNPNSGMKLPTVWNKSTPHSAGLRHKQPKQPLRAPEESKGRENIEGRRKIKKNVKNLELEP